MSAQIAESKLSIFSEDSDFAPYTSWMSLSETQLRRSIDFLYEEIRLTVAWRQRIKTLKLMEIKMSFKAFEGSPHLIWTYRSNGCGPGRRRRVQFEVCEDGKPDTPVAQGELGFDPV